MEQLTNYPSDDIDRLFTKAPYARCNHPIPKYEGGLTLRLLDNKIHVWSPYSLKRFKQENLNICMECAGNSRKSLPYQTEGLQWNNCAVSNVTYSGVLLESLIGKENLVGAKQVIFIGEGDKFKRSLSVELINERPVLLVLSANGVPIDEEHGGPVRLIVPGWYGMANVKWLKQIIISKDDDFKSEYQTEKYVYYYDDDTKEPVSVIKPKSIITSIKLQECLIRGKAWTGSPPLEKVEISLDGIWHETKIAERTGDYGWVSWEKRFTELPSGMHRFCSRAWDKTGCQPDKIRYNRLGYGNNTVQPLYFQVT